MQVFRRSFCSATRLAGAAAQIDALPEIQAAASSPVLDKNAVESLRRAVDVMHASVGPDSELTACAHNLACAASAAVGDFEAGRHTLKAARKCTALDQGDVDKAWARHQALLKLEDPAEDQTRSALDHVIASGEHEQLIEYFDTISGVNHARAQLCFQLAMDRGLDAREKVFSEILTQLEGEVAKVDKLSATKHELAYDRILQNAEHQATIAGLNALIGITLGELARVFHKSEQAVTSEGLFRSALNKLEPLRGKGHLQHVIEPSVSIIARHYAALLSDWENRDKAADDLKERYPVIEPHSHMHLLVSTRPWFITPYTNLN
mmetsp:Transcript_17314/g.30517  ORF Transcript_17314/g.30517 Transcript_17314/m.30517 type:complete len:321 (-) Transcript_17314:55-1017(-)